jgi:hypothetical protein
MSDVPDFIKQDQAEEASGYVNITDLEPLITLLKEKNARIDELTAELAAEQKVQTRLSREDIPEVMNKLGYSELTLTSKEKLSIKQDASVSIPEAKEQLFYDFLKARGEEDIIKLHFAFPRMSIDRQQQLFEFLDGYGYVYEYKQGVHPQTLKAYFKKLLGVGEDDREAGIREGRYLHPDKVRDFTTIFIYYFTKLTAPKGAKSEL